MNVLEHLRWPFFEDRHRAFATALDGWAAAHVRDAHGPDVDALCRRLVRQLGDAGWLRATVAGTAYGGTADAIDTRMLCLARETLARHAGLADFAFGMQGLGSGAISLAGSPQQKARWLPRVARGEAIAAFALSEPDAGSDVGALQCAARIDADHAVLDGEKTWISNGGIADFYVVFARSGESPGHRAGSRPSSSKPARPASRLPSASTSSHRIRSRNCASGTAACRWPTASAPAARASRSRCARSTCSAPAWRRLRWASRGGRSKKACSAPPRARCSARPWPTSS